MKKADIERALAEIGEGLCGTSIDSVYQLDSHTFLLTLYGRGGGRSLLISVKRNAQRFHLLFDKIHRDFSLTTPAVMIMRKYCSRGRIFSIAFDGNVVELLLLRGAEYRLLVDFDSKDLQLLEGEKRIFQLDRAERRTIPSPGADAALSFSCSSGRSRRTDSSDGEPAFNRRLSDEYIHQQNGALARKILSVMRGERKKLGRLLEKLLIEQREVRDKDRYRLRGELLKYNLSRVPKGERSVTLTGFDGEAVTVELDPMLGPRENMDRCFQHYRKLKRREEVIDQKIVFEEKRLGSLDELMDLVRKGEALSISRSPVQFVESIDPGVLTRGFQERVRRVFFEQPSAKDKKKTEAFLRFTSKNGKTILVGRSARENEELTLRMARGNDLWLHVETGSGSHVILRYDRGGEFQDTDIVDAAMLALYFSHYRNAKSGDIVYTHRKYVRKPKNKPVGYVTYHNNRTKRIHFDERVLQRLLDSRPQGLMLKR